MKEKIGNKIFIVGAILVLIGVIMHSFPLRIEGHLIALYLFSAGALGVIIGRLTNFSKSDFRVRRLYFQQFISTCLLVFSAYLLFKEDDKWIITLLIAAVIDLIVIFRMPKEEEKN